MLAQCESKDTLIEFCREANKQQWQLLPPNVLAILGACHFGLRKSKADTVSTLLQNTEFMKWFAANITEKINKQLLLAIVPPVAPEGALKIDDIKLVESESMPTTDLLLHASGNKTVIAHKNELKLVSNDQDMSLFSNYPCSPLDTVYLNINLADLQFMIKSSELKQTAQLENQVAHFLHQAVSSHDGYRCRVRYIDALLAVEALLKQTVGRYKKLEELTNEVFISDSVKSSPVKRSTQGEKASMSFSDIH